MARLASSWSSIQIVSKAWLQRKVGKFRLERVEYKRLDQIEEAARDTTRLPFLKRKAFRDEDEIRLIVEDTHSDGAARSFEDFDLSIIRKISLSPWLPMALVDSVKTALRAVYKGTQRQWEATEVRRTSLLFNEEFIGAGK